MAAFLPYWPGVALILGVLVNQIIANNPKWPYNSLLTALLGLITGMVPKVPADTQPKV